MSLPALLAGSRRNAAILSYAIVRTPPKGRDTPLFDLETRKRLIDTGDLPTPQELADNLVRWLGENLTGPTAGVFNHRDYQSIGLTFDGWARFEELRRGAPSGRNAFMAMQYGDAVLDKVLALHVLWDEVDMAPATRDLKATIRFTIPEAKQQDDN